MFISGVWERTKICMISYMSMNHKQP